MSIIAASWATVRPGTNVCFGSQKRTSGETKPRGIRRVDDRARAMVSFGFCVQVRHGATCRRPMVPHDVLQSLRSVDDGLISLICPTCQMSISALDECRLLCMGLFSTFWLGAPIPDDDDGARLGTVALLVERLQNLHQLPVNVFIPAHHVPGLQRIVAALGAGD